MINFSAFSIHCFICRLPLIKEIEIFPRDEAELPLKSILFNFPVYKDGEDACDFLWDKSTTVSTCPLQGNTSKEKTPAGESGCDSAYEGF